MAGTLKQIEVSSLDEILREIRGINPGHSRITWYRGHADCSWKLLPSIVRPGYDMKKEVHLFRKFKQNAHQFIMKQPSDEFEWLLLMQHYGFHTRLLDWSENPLVGLFFAVNKEYLNASISYDGTDACLWILDPISLNKKAGVMYKMPDQLPLLGTDTDLDVYKLTPTSVSSPDIVPAAVLAVRNSPRMISQFSTFTINGFNSTDLIEIPGADELLVKMVIPAKAKNGILQDLKYFQVSKFTMFPELGNIPKE